MNLFYLIFGILLAGGALMESLWTTLWIDGSGSPLSSRFTTGIWRLMRAVVGTKHHSALSLSGPVTLSLTILLWILMMMFGWSFVFYSYTGSLVSTSDQTPPDFAGTFWYVAYTMFTVGNGDFAPKGDSWQLVSAAVATTGMLMVTLSITYLLQIVSADVNKRSFASQISSIASHPEDFVVSQWTGQNFGAIELQLSSFSGTLTTLNEQHLAYPILHYYHARSKEKASAMSLAILDEALTLIALGVQEEYQPPKTILQAARATTLSHLTTLKAAYIHEAEQAPPTPSLTPLREAGIPVVSDEMFETRLKQEETRRKLMLGLINNAAWHWPRK